MKIPKTKLITATLAMSGALSVIFGIAIIYCGLGGIAIIKVGELLSPNRSTFEKMFFYGFIGASSGLLLSGASAAISCVGSEKVKDELATQFLQNWEEFEQLKKSCRGCRHYKGGGHCGLHGQSKFDCVEREEKQECTSCKYYSGNSLLPCAVHPELKRNCSDWELK